MWRILLCAAATAVTLVPAHAKCGTQQLDGTWLGSALNSGSAGLYTIDNGDILSGNTLIGTISQSKSCKITGTVEGAEIRGWSEIIPSSSSRKPKVIKAGGPAFVIFTLIRR